MYTFTVRAEVAKTAGKFASRDSIEAELQQALEDADPQSLSPDESEYDVIDWSVEAGEPQVVAKKATSKDREYLDTIYELLCTSPAAASDEYLQRMRAGLGRHLGRIAG